MQCSRFLSILYRNDISTDATQNATMRRRPGLLDPKTATRTPTKVAMATARRATMMIFFLFFERQPTSKDFELWHLQTFENALDSPWLTVSLSSSRTSTCELSFSVFPEKKVLSHLFLSSTLHSRELPACLEVPVGHLLEDDLQKQISRLNS